jgi:hypothetical protein
MKPRKFDEIVCNMTEIEVQKQINEFEGTVRKAAMKLLGRGCCHDLERAAIQLVASGADDGWPEHIWSRVRDEISGRLIAQLDVVQQAMLAPPASETRNRKPAESKTE